MAEKDFQNDIAALATARGWFVYHPYDSRRSTPGWPDLVLIRDRILYRELKDEKGKLSVAQREVGEKIKAAGGDWDVWRPSMAQSIEEVLRW